MAKTILIVDGSKEYREYLVDFFRKRDFEATVGMLYFIDYDLTPA